MEIYRIRRMLFSCPHRAKGLELKRCGSVWAFFAACGNLGPKAGCGSEEIGSRGPMHVWAHDVTRAFESKA